MEQAESDARQRTQRPVRGAQGSPEVTLPVLTHRANTYLSGFFAASDVRTRIYWLLHALARHHAVRTANAMAFDLFLAMIPMLALAGWVTAHLVQRSPRAFVESSVLLDLTPAQLRGFIKWNLDSLSAVRMAPFALLVCLWLSSSAFATMIGLFEETLECRPRSWLKTRLLSLGLALLGLVLFVSAGGTGMLLTLDGVQSLGPALGALRATKVLSGLLVGAGVLGATAYLALIYRVAVVRPGVKRRVWAGAATATLLGAAASGALAYYVAHIASYALFYGSLAAIVVVLLWLWLWCSVILLGAEINVALEDLAQSRSTAGRAG